MEEKLRMLEEAMEMDEGELKEDMTLEETECWDSLAKLSFIVLMKDEYNKKITGEDIKKLQTVKDVLALMC